MRQLRDVEQTDVRFAALDPAYVVPMELRQFGELFLRQSTLYGKSSNLLSEDDSWIELCHPAIFPKPTIMRLHRLSVRRSATSRGYWA